MGRVSTTTMAVLIITRTTISWSMEREVSRLILVVMTTIILETFMPTLHILLPSRRVLLLVTRIISTTTELLRPQTPLTYTVMVPAPKCSTIRTTLQMGCSTNAIRAWQ